MDVKSMEAKILALKKSKEKIDARLENYENKFNQEKRKEDTRKKILIGSYVMDTLERKGNVPSLTNDVLISLLDKFLTRKTDRAIFGLKILETEEV